MMSNTAERFCDWATSAAISSAVASASMSKRTVTPLKPLRISGSAPRMPRMFIVPSTVAVTERSWMPRCWATAATPAVRQLPSADRTISTGVAPWSIEAKHSGWSASNVNVDVWTCSWPRPENPVTVERLCVPRIHSVVERQVNSAASGMPTSASRAASERRAVDTVVDGLVGSLRGA